MSYDDNNPKHRAELEAYLTRPKATQEEAAATWNKRESEFNEERKQKLKADKDMETYVKNTTANNANPNSFKKLVAQDEAEAMEKRGQQTVALRTAANKLKTNKADYILTEDRNGLMVNKNRTIAVRDSFIARQFNRALDVEPEATPKQYGELAERLERNRQQQGKPSKLNDLKDSYKDKPFTKIANNLGKKPIAKKPIKPFKFPEFKIDPVLPPEFFKPHTPDPEFLRQQQNFDRMLEESRRPKGLAGILGLKKND
jgi:hypothetical protein|tara:strand:+ start:1192 stop:1962 length:771 start_codon:yes stop_codon:yes gene_type:complete